MRFLSILFAFFFAKAVMGVAVPSQHTPDSTRLKYKGHKGSFYFYWGYNRAFFSRSNIHLSGPDYDFTVYNVTAHDRPCPFQLTTYLSPGKFSIPQFNVRAGYFITKNLSISAGYDHMKYVMDNGQTANMSGVISPSKSKKYGGTYLKSPTVLADDLLKFEHTDGLNVLTVDVEYNQALFPIWKGKLWLTWVGGIGGIWVVPRSDVRVMGEGLNNDYHMAGYAFTGKTGLRLEIFKNYFLSAESRGGYISLPSVLVANEAPERADHNFSFIEYYIVAGTYFRLHK